MRKFETKNAYTASELLESLKQQQFPEGVPELGKQTPFSGWILFPAIDLYNQTLIMPNSKPDENGRFKKWAVICGNKDTDWGSFGAGIALDALTDGWASMFSFLSGHDRKCWKQVDSIADRIKQLDL